MILGNCTIRDAKQTASLTRRLLLFILIGLFTAGSALAVSVETDSTVYYFGETVNITGLQYGTTENVTVDLTDQYGFVVDSWSTYSDALGSFLTKWVVPTDGGFGDTLTLVATGESSGLVATTSIISPKEYLNQMKNGTSSSTAEWSNGNINTSNSCYIEGAAVAYRYFLKDLDSADQHFIDITFDATKSTIHAFDYLTDYDLSEAVAIAASGGVCGTIATSPPSGCTTPTASLAFPDPSDSSSYVSIPGDMADITNGSFPLDGPRNISAYNVILDSMGLYTFGGTTSDRDITIRVYFTVDDDGSAGLFWGGHLSEGTPITWGIDNGASSLSGAPYHMSVLFDGSGGSQNRSVHGITQCTAPSVALSCAIADSVCADSTYTCSTPAGADSYDWTVTGGSIVSGQGTSSITYSVDGTGTYSNVTIIVSVCDTVSGCAFLECCAEDTAIIPIGDCSIPCTAMITCPPDITLECDQSTDTSNTGSATYSTTGDCGVITLGYSDQSTTGTRFNESVITRTWAVVEGGTDTLTTRQQIITIQDTTAPMFDQPGPADVTVACDAVPTAPTMTATDNCDVAPTVTFNENSTPGTCTGDYTLTRTWIAADECGNADSCVQIITVEDTTPPVFDVACPADMTVECDAVPTAPTLTATDNCDPAPVVTYSESTLPGAGNYTLSRMWIATDDCGNADTCIQVITVQDNTAPIFVEACPNDTTVECSAVPTAPILTATDNCDLAPVVTFSESTTAGSCANNYVLTREWIAIDDAGNADTCTQIITVLDTTAPIFDQACPTNMTVECDAVPTAPTLTASDNCDTAPVVTFSESTTPGACTDNYTITRQWVASDVCGNADTCTQVITVEDTTAPAFDQTCPTDITVECDAVPTAPTLTATDNCDPAPVVTFSESTTPGACTDNYTITRQWIATDVCGNADTCTQIITVQDTTDPVCQLPNDTTIVLCDLGTICLPVTATDNCSNTIDCQISSGPGTMVSGEWCYDATSGSETVVVDFICTDECGNFCLKTVTINLEINTAPVLTITAPDSINLCSAGELVCADLTVVDIGNSITSSADFGTVDLVAGTVCFTADTTGVYCNTVIVTDTCGLADTASYCIVVGICDAPLLAADQTIDHGLLCDTAAGCIPAPSVSFCGTNLTWTMNGSAYSPGTDVCYTISETSGDLSFVYIVVDSCARADTSTVSVVATFNQPPTIDWNPPSSASMCPGDTSCFGIGGIEDPDNNIVEYNLISGPPGSYLTGGFIYCVVGGWSGMATIIFEVVDACGASVVDTFTYEQITREPIDIPDVSYDFFFCQPGSVTLPAPAEVAWPIDSIYYNGSLFTADSFTVAIPGSGSSDHLFELFHYCDYVDTVTVTVNASVNTPPILTVDAPDSLLLCDNNNSLCIPYTVVDPDNGLTVTSLLGTVNETLETICFSIDSTGLYCDRVIVTDSCGAADTVDYCVRVILDPTCFCPTITIEKTHGTYQGHYENVTVSIDELAYGMGGFDLLISYDPSALSFVGAVPGDMLTDCGWEYFTYRFGENGNCGANACPSGVLRLTALAETNNGPNHPACYGLFSGDIAYLRFMVTNNRDFECQYIPIQFIWYDCGDNTISSVEGDTLYISGDVYSFEGSVITDLGAEFPSYFGANSSCDIGLGDGKPDPIRCADFVNGGIDIVCADSIDGVGDINLNEVPYEIADAVLFSNYFVYGLAPFVLNLEGQIAATDVNKDGIVLSVADLVYLINVIVGDALAYSKKTPDALTYRYDGTQLTFNGEAAAVALTVRGNRTPLLTDADMEMKYAYNVETDLTHVLVYSMQSGLSVSGSFLDVSGELVSIEASSSQGTVVKLTDLPMEFGLDQNYPNPFNPITTISFTLPKASGYDLSIYNIRGQVVAQFSGNHDAGRVAIKWDASDRASGVYFYRLRAGDQTAVRKMILLK